jgi:hypothetical protein
MAVSVSKIGSPAYPKQPTVSKAPNKWGVLAGYHHKGYTVSPPLPLGYSF